MTFSNGRLVSGLAFCAVTAVVWMTFPAGQLRAGDGDIAPDPANPGGFVVNASAFVDLPRTTAEVEAIQEQLQGASKLMCDYTDGLFRFGTVTFENHPARKKGSDIWWFRRHDRANAPGTFGHLPDSDFDGAPDNNACILPIKAPLAAAGGRINIYGTQAAEVIAHEFGHLIFGLGDHYSDTRGDDSMVVRSTNFNGVELLIDPASGLPFFRSPVYGDAFKDHPFVTTVPVAPLGPDVYRWNVADPVEQWWQVNNSMMQEAQGQVCVDATGRSGRQVNPLLWVDFPCISAADANADGIDDDCGPRCIDGINPGAPCRSDADCPGAGGRCNGPRALLGIPDHHLPDPQCISGDRPGAPCSFDGDCGLGGFCRGAAAHLACTMGAPLGGPCTQNADCGMGGVCSPVGFPSCTVGVIGMNSELSVALNHERSRFDMSFGISSPPGLPPTGVPTGHPQAANHLVVHGFLYPSSDDLVSPVLAGQPNLDSGGDHACFNHGDDYAFDPLGGCEDRDLSGQPDFCNPAIVPGDPAFELQCQFVNRRGSAACPGQALPTSPDFTTPRDVQCDNCVLANSTQCAPMFPAGAGANQCGNGAVDAVFAGAAVQQFEQCDTGVAGVIDPTQPVIDPDTGLPLRCRDLFSPWRVNAGAARADTAPNPVPAGGVVRCQNNCFFDLSECSLPYLEEDFVDADLDGVLTLQEAADQSTAWTGAEVFDSGGRILEAPSFSLAGLNLDSMGPSNHGVFTFFRRMLRYRAPQVVGRAWPTHNNYADHLYREVWQLVVALDAAELCPGSAGCPTPNPFSGRLHEVRRFELEFEMDYPNHTSSLVSVNGVSCGAPGPECLGADDTQWPTVHLGFDPNPAGVDPYVSPTCHFSDCSVAPPATGVFQRHECTSQAGCVATITPPVTLKLDLSSLIVAAMEGPVDHGLGVNVFAPMRNARTIFNYRTFAGPVHAYARNGLHELSCAAAGTCSAAPGAGLPFEVPQYGTLRYRYGLEMPVCASDPTNTCCYRCDDPASVNKMDCVTHDLNFDGMPDVDACRYYDAIASFQDYYGYNEVTKTYESTGSTFGMLQRQFFGGGPIRGYDAVMPQAPAIANPSDFIDSDWTTLQKVMCSQYGITLPDARIPQDGPNVVRDPAAVCDTPVAFTNPEKAGTLDVFNQDTQIMFVLDQSGSMNASEPTLPPGIQSSRLDFVKNAANSFVQDMLASAALDPQSEHAPKIGVVWFSDFPKTKFPDTNSVDCATGRTACTTGAADGSNVCAILGSNQQCVSDSDCDDSSEECFVLGTIGQCGDNARCADKLRYVSYTGSGAGETSDESLASVLQPKLVHDPSNPTVPKKQPEIPTAGVPEDNPDDACETCSDGGFTGSGAALLMASQLFDPTPRVDDMNVAHKPTFILVFLSDGLHNRPKGGTCLGTTYAGQSSNDDAPSARCQELFDDSDCKLRDLPECWPTSVADDTYKAAVDELARDKDGDGLPDILVYAIPLANEADRLGAAVASGATLGEVFNATRPLGEDTVPQFTNAQATAAGQQLARSHLTVDPTVTVDYSDVIIEMQPAAIRVETGAPMLTVRISDADAADQYLLLDEHLDPADASTPFVDQIALVSPDLDVYRFVTDQTDPRVTVDRQLLSAAIHVSAPVGGIWHVMRVRVLPPGSSEPPTQPIYVTAQTGTIEPTCYAFASTTVTDGSQPITITAQASYEKPIIEGATYRAQLLRPDQILVDLHFARDPVTGTYQAVVPPSQLVGRGNYEINVECDVAEGAVVDPGEPGHGPAPATPIQPVPFKRQVPLSFFYDTATFPPVPGGSGNNQPQDVLDGISARTCEDALAFAQLIFPGAFGMDCDVPPSTAPVERFADDADHDGILNEDEGPPGQDLDGDGIQSAMDPDDNGNETPDGRDPRFCEDDTDPPEITAPAVTLEACVGGNVDVTLTISALDDSCADRHALRSLTGALVSINGVPPSMPVVVDPEAPVVSVPAGTSVVEWTAEDINGNVAVVTQNVIVTLPADCCVPTITATQDQLITRCSDTPSPTTPTVSASSTCGGAPPVLSGQVLSVNGSPVSSGAFTGTSPILPEGEVVIRWTATAVGTATLDQTVIVTFADTPAACCPAGSTLVEGSPFSDALIRLGSQSYCIFGYGGFDLLLGGPVADVLSGGSFSDELVGGGVGDVLYGRSGADQLTINLGGTAFGGSGPDSLFAVLGSSTLYGGDGPDAILGSPFADEIIPGPGPDAVEAGAGNDIVRIYDLCEILPGEALDGGPGVDTLYTPVPVADLLARNVVLTGFEAFVVTGSADGYKSECACTIETCGDFMDNDCDGTTDEGHDTEICHDHVDNTCEGLVDEGCPGGPCASATSTVDQHVTAGRAVASSCPGSTTDLVFDNFASGLTKWTETGEGDWNTETLHSILFYPSGASGSPAAHADGCGTSCTLTLTTALDLRGSTSATLEFLRFVDVELDLTDYLRVELYNGATWNTAFSWTGASGDDDRWHAESYDLSAYLGVANFKVRLVMKADSIIEHVHIDDLRVKKVVATTCYTAVGSGANLGSNGAASVTLYETAPNVWSQTCSTGACVPTSDACDGIDNDCDSKIDETCAGCLACDPSDFCGTDLPDFCGNQLDCGCGGGQVCTSATAGIPGDCCTPLQCLPGFCGFDVLNGCGGVQDCRSNCGAGTYCPALLPGTVLACAACRPEICFDGLDNDCDGGVDDGCGICVDYTSTVASHLGFGRAVGSGCTRVTLFTDPFASLTQWTESGEGDWNTETLHATTGYPATGSNSPALHADGCTTTCTMTQGTSIDLRGKASPRLEFLRFVDDTLDLTDYLEVQVWNGFAWHTAYNWFGGSGDDNLWHAESLDLTPYANVSNFRVRFVTKVSLTDEHVHIDDVRITTATGQVCTDYRAVGSNDSLGANLNATVTLAEFPAGHFETGSCP